MRAFVFLTLFLWTVIVEANKNETVPIVMWHGMGDTCCNPLSLGRVAEIFKREVPGIYVHSLKFGSNPIMDAESGFLANMNELVDEACRVIQQDKRLKKGYNAVGFSQGGLFLRAVAQRCPHPRIKNLISIGGPQQGVYGFPYCPGSSHICKWVRNALNLGTYTPYVQKHIVQAQYWHNPFQNDDYKNKNMFLADINNEKNQNDKYKKNLLALNNFVMVMFNHDEMIVPKQSAWFGYYPDNSIQVVLDMNQTTLYQKDLIGIKTLNKTNRLKFIALNGNHLAITEQELVDLIVKPYLS